MIYATARNAERHSPTRLHLKTRRCLQSQAANVFFVGLFAQSKVTHDGLQRLTLAVSVRHTAWRAGRRIDD